MTKIYIEKKRINGYEKYIFRPVGYIEDFRECCGEIRNLWYDKVGRFWSAPANPITLEILQRAFGVASLDWQKVDHVARPQVPRRDEKQEESPPLRSPPASKRSTCRQPVNINDYSPHWQEALHKTEEQLRVKRYSWRTVKSYLSHLRLFFAAHPEHTVPQVTSEVIRTYIVNRVAAGNYSESTQGQMLNSIKFWLEQVEGREKAFIELRPKKARSLPKVLSVEEVVRLFRAIDNIKHRCVLKTIYSGGLRLSEVCNLRIVDIQSDRMQIFVHGGKGKKDRYTTLSQALLKDLRKYFKIYRPHYWLFEGQTGGQYSVRSVQAVLRKAVDKSGINPYATVHTLRHSYATHLLEQGTSLRHIQELLGHENSRTTEIYTHVSNKEKQRVISPLDRLEDID